MPDSALPTLLHVFESGAVPWPAPDSSVLVLNAPPEPDRLRRLPGELHLVQGFRPAFLVLRNRFPAVAPLAEGEGYSAAILLCGRHRGQNEAWLADAVARTAPGARVVVAGLKTEGIDSLRRRFAETAGLGGHLYKHHGVAFWFARPDHALSFNSPAAETPVEGRFHTAPGMFSHDRVDPGSRLLAENLPADLAGAVADFCSGWGYLAAMVAERCPAVTALDLYEADFASLQASRDNVPARAGLTLNVHWHDLIGEPVTERYDAIVMNPPFHQGRAADPGIGQAMVRRATSALRPGGRLFMVANRHLPYEAALSGGFSATGELARDGAFKVLWATR